MKDNILFILFFFFGYSAQPQILKITPTNPTSDDSVNIVFDAREGNKGIINFNGQVYIHCGLITTQSSNGSDWKNVATKWAKDDTLALMNRIDSNRYWIGFNIRKFFNVLPTQQVLRLAMLFRNVDGSKVGRSSSNNDIFYDINILTPGNYVSHSIGPDGLSIKASNGDLQIKKYISDIIKVSFIPTGVAARDSNILLDNTNTSAFANVDDYISYLLLRTASGTTLKIHKFPLRISYLDNNSTAKFTERTGIYYQYGKWGVSFDVSVTEAFYGTGPRAIDLNLRGKSFSTYNQANYGYSFGAQTLNINVPFVVSSNLYGLFFNNFSTGNFNIANTDSTILQYACDTLPLSYFIFGGNSMGSILNKYTALTGKQPLPARWSLGYIQSKYGYQNETEARSIVNKLQTANFPLDALVLDLFWFGSASKMGNLDWDKSKWTNPSKMMSDFRQLGVKTILITEPYFTTQSSNYAAANSLNYFAKNNSNQSYVMNDFWAGSASLLDMYKSDAQNWMWQFYKGRVDEGVDGWWSDLGEPEKHPDDMIHVNGKARLVHNLYSFHWAELLKRKFDSIYPNKRLFNLIRSGYAGSQRFGAIPWSGDIQRSWDGLKAQVPLMLNSSMSGLAYMHSDAGGFTGGGQNEELYVRWLQFAAFSPIMRAHGEGVPPEPVFYSSNAQSIIRNFINLRYSLLPYNYSLAYSNTTEGKPLARPMSYFEPQNKLTYNLSDQYYWGDNIVVAPVLQAGISNRNVYLPAGEWYDYFNKTWVDGGQSISRNLSLNDIPLYIRGGSIIPIQSPRMSTDYMSTDSLNFVYYYSEKQTSYEGLINGRTRVYEDNGYDAKPDIGLIDVYSAGNASVAKKLDIQITTDSANVYFSKPLKFIEFKVLRINKEYRNITLIKPNGNKLCNLKRVFSMNDYLSTDSSFYYDGNANLLLHFNWYHKLSLTISINDDSTSSTSNLNKVPDFAVEKVYPNPAKEKLNIDLQIIENANYKMELFNMKGMMVCDAEYLLSKGFQSHEFILPNGLNKGIYLFKITSDNTVFVKKVIIE
jgi:alpha-glucosidase (family GH31 glycosyl hydrolase)